MALKVAVANQKGGVGKTTTALNLGVALAAMGARVLLVDMDHQASLTAACGVDADGLQVSVADMLDALIDGREPNYGAGVIHTREGVDLIGSDLALSSVDLRLSAVAVGRERLVARLLEPLEREYDLVLLDCAPALSLITINDLVAADRLIVPVVPQFLSVKGLDLLLGTVAQVRQVNPGLSMLGVLVTMRERRRKGQDEVEDALRGMQGLPVFDVTVPKSVRAEEAPGEGSSLLAYDAHGPVAAAYRRLAVEVWETLAGQGRPLSDSRRMERAL